MAIVSKLTSQSLISMLFVQNGLSLHKMFTLFATQVCVQHCSHKDLNKERRKLANYFWHKKPLHVYLLWNFLVWLANWLIGFKNHYWTYFELGWLVGEPTVMAASFSQR